MNRPPKTTRTALPLSALALGGLVTGGLLFAGPLDPPVGPVGPTYKTLTEVEPRIAINPVNTPGDDNSLFRITQPGSYYLVDNVTGVAGKSGIEIAASNVTIDLMGLTLQGVPSSLMGIGTDGVRNHVTVRNGVVSGWVGAGVGISFGAGAHVEAVTVTGNGMGVMVGPDGTVRSCVARANSQANIYCMRNGLIQHCVAESGTGVGINAAGENCNIVACAASDNASDGISANIGCSITQCTAASNDGTGINTAEACSVTDCNVNDNTGHGIRVNSGSTVTGCNARSSGSNGITAAGTSTITSCSAYQNAGDGINVASFSFVLESSAVANAGDGIEILNNCTVTNCSSGTNGNATTLGAGVRVTGTVNVVDNNTLNNNRFGITVPGSFSVITRNRCGRNLNANYDIGVNNYYGPVINRFLIAAPAVSGNSGASSLGTSDPWANIAY